MNQGDIFGRGIGFPPRVGEDGRVSWSEGADNVRESIRTILLTDPGERLMLPRFGGGLSRFLFEPNTVTTRRLIQEQIERALNRWEPRIELRSVNVVADPDEPRAAVARISYALMANRQQEQLSLKLDLAG